VGTYTSVTTSIIDGTAIVAYFDETNQNLKLAKCSNLVCSTAAITVVATKTGKWSSITLGLGNTPIISFVDFTNYTLSIVQCNNDICSSPVLHIVDQQVSQTSTSVFPASDGLVMTSYQSLNGKLKLVKCNDVSCFSTTSNVASSSSNSIKLTRGQEDLLDVNQAFISSPLNVQIGKTLEAQVVSRSCTGGAAARRWLSNNHCYIYFSDQRTFYDALTFCQSIGGYLATFGSKAEIDFARTVLIQGGGSTTWMGYSDVLVEGQFLWITGEIFPTAQKMVFSNWTPGEPNNSFPGEDCGQMYITGLWNDISCNSTIGNYICERPF